MFMTLFWFADMMHMVVYTQFEDECMEVDLQNEFDTFADFCSDTLLRSALRLFASLAGDAGRN